MKLLAITELRARGIRYTEAHIRTLIRAGKFPKPIKLGPKRIAFIAEEIDAWIADRIAERDASTEEAA